MNVSIRKPAASHHPSRRQVSSSGGDGRRAESSPLAAAELDESGETTNEDNFESADEDQLTAPRSAARRLIPSNNRSAPTTSSHGSASSNANTLVQTVGAQCEQRASSRRHHQLQLQAHTNNTGTSSNLTSSRASVGTTTAECGQNNLMRGKQQRASISSCSSSDSYASYGSGYASGSGNSTDHEHKQQQLLQQGRPAPNHTLASCDKRINVEFKRTSSNNNQRQVATPSTKTRSGASGVDVVASDDARKHDALLGADHDDEIDDGADEICDGNKAEAGARRAGEEKEEGVEVEDDDHEDEEEEESQLKKHLNELERLTDELAKRDIFNTFERTTTAQTNDKHYSSTINNSNSSPASSVLSTSSNISSLTSNSGAVASRQASGRAVTASTNDAKQQGQLRQQQQAAVVSTPPPSSSNQNNESRSSSSTPTTVGASAKVSRQACSPHQSGDSSASLSNCADAAPPTLLPATNRAGPSAGSTPNKQQDTYYHNLFQWEQLVSKGVTRPLLINDLDFTDLRDEDDCDLLNSLSSSQAGGAKAGRTQFSGEPLTISIPSAQHEAGHDSVDSGASISSTGSGQVVGTPASAPPPMPPPPISPWFNTIAGSRPQSQIMSSPSPPPAPFELNALQRASGDFNRDQSPANSTCSSSYSSRNSVCVGAPNQGTSLGAHFSTLQPKSVGNLRAASSMSSLLFGNGGARFGTNKRKKTMKLFWKEVREDKSLLAKLTKKKTIWDEIKPVPVDTQKLEYLFESKAKDLSLSKSRNGLDGGAQRKLKITVLDAKRSNAINIGMTKLPPMRTIKSAILKMDSSIMNREGIEKILTTMMPSEEEKSRIIEAQLANPDTPLGTAEQFLLNLASISALEARLKLWAFQLDYAQIEKEVAEPLMDLKQAIGEIERSETFRVILGTLLSIGNFLNSTNAKGFQIDYLEKVPEVKDTVHKHSLLHHLCLFIQEKYPELDSDLYSEFSAVNRASKVDYSEVAKNLKKMQQDCKASWDHLKIVAKHDGLANLMNTCGMSSASAASPSSTSSLSSSSCDNKTTSQNHSHQPKTAGKLNNLSKLSMITTVIGSESCTNDQQHAPATKQLKIKVSDFLTDCAERIMVLMVIHRRVINRFQKLLVYLGCPSHQIKQTQPQQILKIINEFALEYRTKRARVREMLMRVQKCPHHNAMRVKRWQMGRWAGSQQCIDSIGYNNNNRPFSTTSSCASPFVLDALGGVPTTCPDCAFSARHERPNEHANQASQVAGANRCNSPSGVSQISNYSDYMFDGHSCCGSRRESVTPIPSDKFMNSAAANRRAHSMSVSMFDLQNQQQQNGTTAAGSHNSSINDSISELDSIDEADLSAQQKDEQLRRLLGVDKSFYGACRNLYQMKHWSSTMARVNRPESQAKLATIRRMSGQQLERRESDEHGQHALPT